MVGSRWYGDAMATVVGIYANQTRGDGNDSSSDGKEMEFFLYRRIVKC